MRVDVKLDDVTSVRAPVRLVEPGLAMALVQILAFPADAAVPVLVQLRFGLSGEPYDIDRPCIADVTGPESTGGLYLHNPEAHAGLTLTLYVESPDPAAAAVPGDGGQFQPPPRIVAPPLPVV